MNKHNQIWMEIDCERHINAIIDSLNGLIIIAGRNEEGSRLVQKQVNDLRKVQKITHDLICNLLTKAEADIASRIMTGAPKGTR